MSKNMDNNSGVISESLLKKLCSGASNQFPTDSIVISSNEFSNIQNTLKPKSDMSIKKTNNARTQKIIKLEEEKKEKAKKHILSDLEIQQLKEKEEIIAQANAKLLKNMDCAKEIDSLALYAKCAAVRDRQVLQKEITQKRLEKEDKIIYELMEIDRLNAIKLSEDKEKQREKVRKESAAIIVQQLKENERKRLLEKENKIKEGELLVEKMKILELEEIEKNDAKIAEGRRLKEEIKIANMELAKARAEEKERQRLEDEEIAKYLLEKAQREAAFEKVQELKAAQKEKQKNLLKETQMKLASFEKEMEDIRINRAQEKREYEWREREKNEKLKIIETRKMLTKAREAQKAYKAGRLAEQTAQERAEFEKNVQAYKDAQIEKEREGKIDAMKKKEYRDMLQSQMEDKEKYMKMIRDENINPEWRRLKREVELRQLNEFKENKLSELRKAGVPEKYLADLVRYNVKDHAHL